MLIDRNRIGPWHTTNSFHVQNYTMDPIGRFWCWFWIFFLLFSTQVQKNRFCVEPENFNLLLRIDCIVQMNLNLHEIERKVEWCNKNSRSNSGVDFLLLFSIYFHLFSWASILFSISCRMDRVKSMRWRAKEKLLRKLSFRVLRISESVKVSAKRNRSGSFFVLMQNLHFSRFWNMHRFAFGGDRD